MRRREREDYVSPVGFGTEPREEVRRWVGRIVTLAFVGFIIWIFLTKVVSPPQT